MASILTTRIITRNDTAAKWAEVNPVLKKGEFGVENDTNKFKIGDGTAAWNDLAYAGANDECVAAHYEGEAAEGETDTAVITRVMGATAPANDDIFVVKRVINGDKKSFTSYVYNGTAWAAMDGNYDAGNVYFSDDLVATEKVGTISIPASGSATVAAAGKSVKEVLASILAAEKQPTVSQPSVSVSLTNGKAYEVGTKVVPAYTTSFNKGSYSYGPDTGISVSAWAISNTTNEETKDTANGSFGELTVADGMNFKVTAKATYGAGATPKTNIGNEAPSLAIAAGSKSATSSAAITGFRSYFYGFDASASADAPIDSSTIRALTNAGKAAAANAKFTIKAADTTGAKRAIVAVPAASSRTIKGVSLDSTMNLDITSQYVKIANVEVEGVNGATAVPYSVYVYEPAKVDAGEIHTITLG